MLDLLLGRNGDLQISDMGDIALTNSVAQAITVRLRWFLGEWKYNPAFGVPYYEEILVKNASRLRVEQLIREQILSVKEVRSLPELKIAVDEPGRKMVVRFTAVTDIGQISDEVAFDV